METLKREDVEVILLGVRGGLLSDRFQDMFEEIAEEKDVLFVSNVLSGVIAKPEFMSDAVHPNASGYARIAQRILPVLQKACALVAQDKDS
jgi:lysophospholipase L1-like esterase